MLIVFRIKIAYNIIDYMHYTTWEKRVDKICHEQLVKIK